MPRVSLAAKSAFFVSLTAAFLSAAIARAEDEVRISIVSAVPQVRIAAKELAVFDGDVGDRVAWSKAQNEITVVRSGKNELRIKGKGLEFDRESNAAFRTLLFEAQSGIRVDGKLYLGRVSVGSDAKGVFVINRLPLETYLLGIVGSEMPPSWSDEALKAQAVAARTYAVQRRMYMRAGNKPYDLESNVLSQVYNGAENITPSVVQAVLATRGEVLSFRHFPLEALFHSTCGGSTVSSRDVFGQAVPYLVKRPCTFCKPSTKYRWQLELPLSEISKRLKSAKIVKTHLTEVERDESAKLVSLKNGTSTTNVTAKALRAALGYSVILSERFSAKTSGKGVIFEGRGFGHGVGMCQWGAKGLAERGLGYREILGHYYQGARIKRIY